MNVVLGSPRGYCAGVARALDIVELCLERFGTPVYVRHEIIHNPHVVNERPANMIGRASYHTLNGSHGPRDLNTNQLLKTLELSQSRWNLTLISSPCSSLARSLIDDNSETPILNGRLHTSDDRGFDRPSCSGNKTEETSDVRENPWRH